MFVRLREAAALAALFTVAAGCRGIGCGGSCGNGASYAFSKYDCSCDPCCNGTYGCGSGGQSCGCRTQGSRPILDALCGCSGCGELYWNEWYNDPPAVCEPCDARGNYAGPRGGVYGAAHQAPPLHFAGAAPASPKSSEAKPLRTARAPEAPDSGDLVR
jgi:hypothetical protein